MHAFIIGFLVKKHEQYLCMSGMCGNGLECQNPWHSCRPNNTDIELYLYVMQSGRNVYSLQDLFYGPDWAHGSLCSIHAVIQWNILKEYHAVKGVCADTNLNNQVWPM